MLRNNKEKLQKIFSKIYYKNGFKGKDSISGPGSDLEQTKTIRDEIPRLIDRLNIKTLLDIPCGDFYWMKLVELNNTKYIGGDIVSEIIDYDNKNYSKPNVKFSVINLLEDKLPNAELLLCRDCLVHLSYQDILKALQNIKKSPVEYLLTTTFPDRSENLDIRTGQWRPLNLNIAPFNFPEALFMLNEKCTENNSIYRDKSLGLWKVDDLPDLNFIIE